MGLPTYLPTCFLLLPSWGVLTSRSYREVGSSNSLPTSPQARRPRPNQEGRSAARSPLTTGRTG